MMMLLGGDIITLGHQGGNALGFGQNATIKSGIYPRVLSKTQSVIPDASDVMMSLPNDVIAPEMPLLGLPKVLQCHFQSSGNASGAPCWSGKSIRQSYLWKSRVEILWAKLCAEKERPEIFFIATPTQKTFFFCTIYLSFTPVCCSFPRA